MKNPITKFFNDKLWNNVKTRKVMLVLAVSMVLAYATIDILIKVFCQLDLADQLTISMFDFAKWIVVVGGGITIAKVVKGKTNSDDEEESYSESVQEDNQ